MVSYPQVKQLIHKSNNLGELREFIRQYLNIRYEWINKVSDLQTLKTIILQDLFKTINDSLVPQINKTPDLSNLNKSMIEKLFKLEIYSKEQKEYFLELKNVKINKKEKQKKSMWKPKKRKQEKAVSV